MKKLIYFPWPAIQASEIDKAKTWIDTGGFDVETFRDGGSPKIRSRTFGQIYLFGHCSSGSDTISNDANEHLTYQELGDRLEAGGLKKTYAGALKVYACESGANPQNALSFAKKLAKYLYFNKKYLLTRVYGYEAPLCSNMSKTPLYKEGGQFMNADDRKKAHKYATSEYYAGNDDVDVFKAKDVRSYFSPFG